jgi:hypothetical protein
METAEQFLKDYLAVKLNFLEKWAKEFSPVQECFFKAGYNPFDPSKSISLAKGETIANVNKKADSTEIITTGYGENNKMRYTLIRQNENYLISLVESECGLCSRHGAPRQDCKFCNGKGWNILPLLPRSSK